MKYGSERGTYTFCSVQCWPVKHRLGPGDRNVQLGLTHSNLMLAAARLVSAPTVKSTDFMLDLTKCQQTRKDKRKGSQMGRNH